jgi:hypothetical protein
LSWCRYLLIIEEPDLVLGESDYVPSGRKLVENSFDAGSLLLDSLEESQDISNGEGEKRVGNKAGVRYREGRPGRGRAEEAEDHTYLLDLPLLSTSPFLSLLDLLSLFGLLLLRRSGRLFLRGVDWVDFAGEVGGVEGSGEGVPAMEAAGELISEATGCRDT